MQINNILLGIVALWLLVLTGFVIYIFLFFRKLSKGVTDKNLIDVLGEVIKRETGNTERIEDLISKVGVLAEDGKSHVQKIGFVRFNPFEELGGDHSFSVALLDGKDSGIVITGLHSRDRTRVYVKEIKKGKSRIELSREEVHALNVAHKNS